MRAKFTAKDLAITAIFLSAALVLGVVERSIPVDIAIPGVKLGLSNAVVLSAIYLLSFRQALAITSLKCVILMLITGNFAAFLYSLSGALLSFAAMFALAKLPVTRGRLSPVGISVSGAVCHNIGQISMAAAILGTIKISAYLPVLLISGVVTGVLVGALVGASLPAVKRALAVK